MTGIQKEELPIPRCVLMLAYRAVPVKFLFSLQIYEMFRIAVLGNETDMTKMEKSSDSISYRH